MSSSTCSPAEHDFIIEEYARGLGVVYLYVMTPTILGSLLLPFLFSLIYFSTHRRQPMFILVLLAVVAGIAQSIMQATIHIRMLYNPINTTATVFTHSIVTSTLVLELLPNWIADLALLYRIMAVYPAATTPRWQRAIVLTPPIVFKVIRVACWIGFDYALTRPGGEPPHFIWTLKERIWTIIERTFTALDNSYATAFFLWKLRGAYHFQDEKIGRASSIGSNFNTLAERVTALLWFSVTNFILPVPLCFLQIGFAALFSNSIVYEIVQHFVNFISVVCVAFATVWYSSSVYRHDLRDDGKGPALPSSLHFRQFINNTGPPFPTPEPRWSGISSDALRPDAPYYRTTLPEKSMSARPSWELSTV